MNGQNMNDQQWNLIRKASYWTLLDLDGRITLPGGHMPKTIIELDFYTRGLSFEFQLDQTLEFTSNALLDVAQRMAEFHRIATRIQVNAPSALEIAGLKTDLQTVNQRLKGDQRFKVGVALAGSVADILNNAQQGQA